MYPALSTYAGPGSLFKIHNPYLPHRVRGKRLRLPSRLLIETASMIIEVILMRVLLEAVPIKASDNPEVVALVCEARVASIE